ncbi:MAG: DUF4365 domain-containing protein [Halopseudomonas sp.]
MKLPQRHRNHQLETASVRKFESLLPELWVYRTPTDDYGIDGEVEIFDDDGSATGEKFLVQLKATDEGNLRKSLNLKMPIEKWNYFELLNHPVLIVRYVAPLDAVYFRWFHRFDPHNESKTEKYFYVKFGDKDLWGAGRSTEILKDLRGYMAFSTPHLIAPLEISLVINQPSIIGNKSASFVSNCLEISESISDLLFLDLVLDGDGRKSSFIEVDDKSLRVVLGGKSGTTFHHDQPLNSEEVARLSNDVYVGIAVTLYRLGYNTQCEFLLNRFFEDSSYSSNFKLISLFASSKLKSGKAGDVFRFIRSLVDRSAGAFDDDFVNGIQFILALLVGKAKKASSVDVDSIRDAYLFVAEKMGALDNGLSATMYYNLASFLHKSRLEKEAIKYYFIAAKLNRDYRERPYWNRDLGSAFFGINKFKTSSFFYRRYLSVEDDPKVRVLYADSLMFAGQFKKSLEEFISALRVIESGTPEWHLKHLCLHAIVDSLGIEEQVMFSCQEGKKIAEAGDEERAYEHIINKNALCPDCWFLIGYKFSERESYHNAVVGFLTSAFSDEKYADSWINAMKCAFNYSDTNMLSAIMMCASEKLGPSIVAEFFDTVGIDSTDWQALGMQAIKSLNESKPEQEPMEIRFGNSESPHSIFLEKD